MMSYTSSLIKILFPSILNLQNKIKVYILSFIYFTGIEISVARNVNEQTDNVFGFSSGYSFYFYSRFNLVYKMSLN